MEMEPFKDIEGAFNNVMATLKALEGTNVDDELCSCGNHTAYKKSSNNRGRSFGYQTVQQEGLHKEQSYHSASATGGWFIVS